MPLFWISLAFLCGIVVSPSLSIGIPAWAVIALLAAMLLAPPFYRRISSRLPENLTQISQSFKITSPAIYLLLIVFFCLGAIRYQLAQPHIDPTFIAFYNDQPNEYLVDGVIQVPPDVGDGYTNLRLRVEQVTPVPVQDEVANSIPVHGLLLARVPIGASYNYGDRIQLHGRLETPPENADFSYRDYLARHGIYSYMFYPAVSLLQQGQGSPFFSALYAFRQHALDLVYSLFPDPEASLMAGILLGVQSGIPQNVTNAFRLTGTSHIIVISGFNITIIAAMFTLVFSRILGVRRGALVAAIGIILYTLLVGANPAVVRAAILGILTLLGYQLGRQQTGLNSLIFVAAVMAVITPSVLWDVSFQLSFAATLGIMLYAAMFTQWFAHLAERYSSITTANRLAGPVEEYFLLTLAAQLTTLPLIIYYFKRLSLTALIANPLILPAQPPLMVLGLISVLSGMVFHPIGQLFAWAAWPFTAYTIRVVEWLAAAPHGSIPIGQVGFPMILLSYTLLFTVTFTRTHISGIARRLTPAVPLAILATLTFVVWKAAFNAPDDRLHVTILDVGTGDAVLIQSPTGRSVLINGGPSTIALSDALGRRLPLFNHSLDWLVVADIDSEDLTAVPGILERFPPTNVLWAGNTTGTHAVADLQTQLLSLSIPITSMLPGQALNMGSGASLRVLATDPKGADLLLEWENFRMLLPMGLDFGALDSLQQNSAMRSISAVMLPESGYAPLNPPELIDFLHPQLALLSVAAGDKTGLPSPETLEALTGYNLLRTDHNGWIEITTDGSQMWAEAQKSP
jgi:competence protein ComEC